MEKFGHQTNFGGQSNVPSPPKLTFSAKLHNFYLLLLSPDGGTLAGDGLETGFDGLYGTAGVTGHALQEEEPGLLVEDGVGAAASVTRHILFNIPENNHFLSTYYI